MTKIRTGQINPSSETWTDYSSSSTITGWASFTNKLVRYTQVGKLVYVSFALTGTSNATNAQFTLPVAAKSNSNLALDTASGLVQDNGAIQTSPARIYIDPTSNANLVVLTKSMGASGWTASGTKDIRGIFFYEAA